MKRRAWERMEDLIQEGARLQRQELEEQEQRTLYQRERANSPILMDEQLFGPRFSLDATGFSATTMPVPLSFSDEGGSAENDNEFANVSENNGDDDLETITDGSSVHTPSSTSHIGPGFMGGSGSAPTSPTSTRPPPLPLKFSPSNSHLCLPSHLLLEYNTLSCLRQRLHSLILFADSQFRIAKDDKRNMDEILLVRGRRKAWLNGELAQGIGGAPTGTSNGIGQTQWGFAAPFKSSPLARYSWSASALEEVSKASATSVCPQQQQVDEEDEDEYNEFHGPPAYTLGYTHGRQSRRSRYPNGGGLCKKLPPVTEEFECENSSFDVNGSVQPPDNSFRHRDDSSFLRLDEEDEDVDSSSDGFSLEDPRELDLELGFGLHDPASLIGEHGENLLGDVNRRHSSGVEHGQRERRGGETSRIAFEAERPKIIPRVRDGLGGTDDDSISMMAVTSSNSSASARSGSGLLSWGYWGVGKNSGDPDGARRCRSWKNGIGIGIGLGSKGRSFNKPGQKELEEEELSRRRVSTSSTASTTSSSSTKQQNRHQVEFEPELHQNQNQDGFSTPCQPVSFSVSHIVPALPRPASTSMPTGSSPTTVAIPPPNADTTTSPEDTTDTPKHTTCTSSVPTNGTKTSFLPTAPSSITTEKLCMASSPPNVYADIGFSVVHFGEDDKNLNRVDQSVNPGAVCHTTGMQAQDGSGGHAPHLRPRRHKREYQYQYPRQRLFNGQDECDEFEILGYGQFLGDSTVDSTHLLSSNPKHQQRHNSMVQARPHLDEHLLEEGLFNDGCHDVTDQEEFTLAMDVPLSGSCGRGNRNFKVLRKMQYLQLRQNRDSVASQQEQEQRSRLQTRLLPPSSSQTTMDGLSGEFRKRWVYFSMVFCITGLTAYYR